MRALSQDDLPALLELTRDRGWTAGEAMWRLVLTVGDGFAVDAPDHGLAGTVVLTRYPPGLAVIGMLLVASRHARRGLGRQLMEHALAKVPGQVVCLYATTQGRPLYERLGFAAVSTLTRHVGEYRPTAPGPGPRVREPIPADRAGVLALDRAVFGADRTVVLTALDSAAAQVLVAEDHRGLVGHAAAWTDAGRVIIGPVVARDDASAQTLIHALAARASGQVRVDMPSRFTRLSRWARERGLLPAAPAPLMTCHGHELPGARDQLYAPVNQALG